MRCWLNNIFLLLGILVSTNVAALPHTQTTDSAHRSVDTTLYQGMSIKLDLATPILAPALSKGHTQQYELALNWRLRYRYYPTCELGYSYDNSEQPELKNPRQGGYIRLGADINALRKNPQSPHALLVGVRVGAALDNTIRCDSWGEIALGCQVAVYEGLTMGWHVRYKILFTRKQAPEEIVSPYIPGFGNRSETQWGLSYYIGYAF